MRSLIAALRSLVLPNGVTSGQRIVLDADNGVILVYDANNDLVGSIAPTAGAGGSWYAGVAQYAYGAFVGLGSVAALFDGSVRFDAWNGRTAFNTRGSLNQDDSGTNNPVIMTLQPATDDPNGHTARLELDSQYNDGVNTHAPMAVFLDGAGVNNVPVDLLVTGVVYAQDPNQISNTRESWHAPALQNSWVNNTSGYAPIGYRKLPNGDVEFEGAIINGTSADNTLLFTLPTAYRPKFQKSLTGAPGSNAGCMHIIVGTDGTVKCVGIAAQPGFIGFDGVHFSTL